MNIETVKVKSKESGYVVINKSDFDPDTMEKATAAQVKAADKKAAKAAEKSEAG